MAVGTLSKNGIIERYGQETLSADMISKLSAQAELDHDTSRPDLVPVDPEQAPSEYRERLDERCKIIMRHMLEHGELCISETLPGGLTWEYARTALQSLAYTYDVVRSMRKRRSLYTITEKGKRYEL